MRCRSPGRSVSTCTVTAASLRKVKAGADRDRVAAGRALRHCQHDLAATGQRRHGILRPDERVADGLARLLMRRGDPVIEFAELLRARGAGFGLAAASAAPARRPAAARMRLSTSDDTGACRREIRCGIWTRQARTGHEPRLALHPVGNVAAEARRTVSAGAGIGVQPAPLAADRALGEAAVLQQAIVQHQRAGHRQVEREPGRDPHHVAAAPQHGRRQAGSLRAQHIGGVHRMAERRQVGGIVQQFDADQHAALRQAQRLEVRKAPQRHVLRRIGGVGQAAGAGVEAGAHDEAERGAEGVRGAQQGADIGRLRHPLDADAEIAA